ncbi:MAG: helix-turn-helix transcriptional regulator [Lachnospiraceae bacterium]|nr:helix-turn-helix transcriptional regulator [Lachnospiraceae bacterium]
MEFGKLLAKLRKERGILQKEVATHLNVTVATISNYEKGVHLPDLNTLIMLADFFDVSTDYMLQRTDYKASIDTLNHHLAGDFTVGDLLNTVMELDAHNTQSLLDYYELLVMRNSIKRVK